MSQTPQKHQAELKKSQTASTSSLHKTKVLLPSRYIQMGKNEKTGLQKILNTIQSKVRLQTDEKPRSPQTKPKTLFVSQNIDLKQSLKNSHFKSHPLKRQQSDKLHFNQVFLHSRQEALNIIQKQISVQNTKTITKQYEKLLKFQKGEMMTEQNEKLDNNSLKQSYQRAIQLLENDQQQYVKEKKNDEDFYNNQIAIQPPTPSGISTAKPNQAPSLPPNYNNFQDLNIKQLLLRAKAGMNSQDIQKEAHLSFLLGEVYMQRRKYKGALRFFKRFLGFAKIMQDRIGMGIGANRVGINSYYCGDYEKSVAFHSQNLKLSSNENCFFGFYNTGICYRKLNKPQTALQYFQSALNWSQQKGQQQSQCITFGQMGVTYQSMQLFQQSVQKFEQSLQICDRIKKKNIKLINLRNILRISSKHQMKSAQKLQIIATQAFQCAKQLGQLSVLDVFRCNIGILKGIQGLQSKKLQNQQIQQIQQIQ